MILNIDGIYASILYIDEFIYLTVGIYLTSLAKLKMLKFNVIES